MIPHKSIKNMGMNWVINSTDIAVFLLSIGIYHVCQTLKIQCYYLYFFNNILQAMKVSSKKATLNNNYVLCHCFSLSLCWLVFQAIRNVLWQDVYPQIKLWEFYQVNVASAVEKFRTLLQNGLCYWSLNIT